jgi:hypothetical protein
LDETYVNQGYAPSKVLHDCSVKTAREAFDKGLTTGIKRPTGRGKRVIVVHIGSEDGFVPGGSMVWIGGKGKKKSVSEDYHDDMDGKTFEGWLHKVLKTLPPKSVVVMDNASYHTTKVFTFVPLLLADLRSGSASQISANCYPTTLSNKTENHFSPYPRSCINLYTRLKIAMQCLVHCGERGKSMQCCVPAYGRKKACISAGLRPVFKLVIFM